MEGERDPVRLHDQALGELIPATMWRELAKQDQESRLAASGVVGEGPRGGPSALCAPFDVLYNFWRPVTAIRNGNMDGKPLQSRTLRDRSETVTQQAFHSKGGNSTDADKPKKRE
jgi:hypothetical protein